MFALISGSREGQTAAIDTMAAQLRGGMAAAKSWHDATTAVTSAVPGTLLEDVFDRQPIIEGDLIFAAEARLDNRDDLIKRLNVEGTAELSDGEVVCRAYRRWGEACVQELYGDFAFAALHRGSGKVVAATDHLCSVRLFYSMQPGLLVLATQLGAVLAHPAVSGELDLDSLALLIAPKLSDSSSPYRNIAMLRGGHLAVFERGALTIRRWWNPDPAIRTRYRDPRDYVEQTRELFDAAVTSCLRSAGAIATSMSGGLDSTLVSATAALQLASRGARLTAYTSVPEPGLSCDSRPGWDPDEWPLAAAVAAMHPNMDHIAVTPGGLCSLDVADDIHRVSLVPMRNTINSVWVSIMAKRAFASGARVLLFGGKGNANISYAGDGAIRDFVRQGRFAAAFRWATATAKAEGRSPLRVAGRELAGAGTFISQPAKSRPGVRFLSAQRRKTLSDMLGKPGGDMTRRADMLKFMTSPNKIFGADFLAQWNVQYRDPTYDRRLIEVLVSFPRDAFWNGGTRRRLARSVGEGRVPDIVRLRTNRGSQSPELAAIIAAHLDTYRAALERAAASPAFREIADVAALREALSRVDGMSLPQASTLDRVFGVASFIAGKNQ